MALQPSASRAAIVETASAGGDAAPPHPAGPALAAYAALNAQVQPVLGLPALSGAPDAFALARAAAQWFLSAYDEAGVESCTPWLAAVVLAYKESPVPYPTPGPSSNPPANDMSQTEEAAQVLSNRTLLAELSRLQPAVSSLQAQARRTSRAPSDKHAVLAGLECAVDLIQRSARPRRFDATPDTPKRQLALSHRTAWSLTARRLDAPHPVYSKIPKAHGRI
ncbi:hypothetical protein AURDEDRAFT_163409 [Auricularia subglabra TFB-10046 SS5]|nr:hypothetical protein AURDEDRAFT_163409 [Auricularia subglabra TFB-10046 SS5]